VIFTSTFLRRVKIHKVVFFISGDKVGEEILNSLVAIPDRSFYLILDSPTAKINLLLDQENLYENVIFMGFDRPPWDEIAYKLTGLGILRGFSWFSHIFPKKIIHIFKLGIINLHNSYLPYNRGRHSTFWAIVDDSPFGASLHWVEEGIDSGNIIDRIEVKVPRFSNASVVYNLQLEACIQLAKRCIPRLFQGEDLANGQPQNSDFTTHHFAREIELASSFSATSVTTWEKVVKMICATSTEKGSIQINYPDGASVKIRGNVIEVVDNTHESES